MLINYKPVGDKVLVDLIPPKSHTAGGLLVPESVRDQPVEGVVVKLGTGQTGRKGDRTEFQVQVGDRVLIPRFDGEDVVINRRTFKQFNSHQLLAIVQ